MKTGVIYLITNTVNGKVYVGKTEKALSERWRLHCAVAEGGSPFYLHKAIRQHGAPAFNLQVLAHAPLNEINQMEKIWILLMNALAPTGYNCTYGGEGGSPTEELRQRLSKERKEMWATPEGRAKYIAATSNPERRRKISEAHKELFKNPENRRKRVEQIRKQWKNPDYRRKMSAARMGNQNSHPKWKPPKGMKPLF